MEDSISKALCQFTFEGEQNEVDAQTLSQTLASLHVLAVEASDTLYPDTKCNLKVTATEQGSFVVGLMVVSQFAQNLLTPQNISYAQAIVGFIKTSIELKQFIGSKKPKEVRREDDRTVVVRHDNETRTYNANAIYFFENPVFDRTITDVIAAAGKVEEVNAVSFKDETDGVITINNREFPELSQPVIEEPQFPTKVIKSTDTMFVQQATFIGDEKWKFTKNRPISAKITDREWLDHYRDGKFDVRPKFQLRFDMETTLKMKDGWPVESSATYEITKIHEIIPPESFSQTTML